jgi:NAD(P)-dependent dehydrogenase (short-subunit alcohol dehydrogenase family)
MSCITGTMLDEANQIRNISLNSYKLKSYQRESKQIMKKLEGKIAVITGGSSGIGLATAQRFVDEGAYVFITGRRQSELDAAVKQIGKNNNNNVTGVHGDVSNLEDLDRLYDTVKQQKGRIDVLFANAGIIELAPLGSITESHFDKMFNINVKGLLFSVQKALPLFQNGRGGSIILTASVGGSKGFETSTVYGATKAAIRSFARTWTVELKQRKIRVNAISPGPIDTPMSSGADEQLMRSVISTVPMGRMGSPDEVAKAASFLASDDSSYVTGIELFVDGGAAQI